MFQSIINADHAFQKCLSFIVAYNEAVNEDRFLNANSAFIPVYIHIIENLLKGIDLSYNEAITINNNAREKIISIGKEVFGKKFILPAVDNDSVKATDI